MGYSQIYQSSRGVTLIETLVYMAVFVVLSVGAVVALFNLADLYAQYLVRQSLHQSATMAMERILLEVRQADVLHESESQFLTDSGALELGQGTTTTRIFLDNEQVRLQVDGVDRGPLHAEAVTIDTLRFYQYETNGRRLIRMDIEMTASRGAFSQSLSVAGAATMRGSYSQE